MQLTILGCGTSTGVPVAGCRCEVCTSPDPKNHRTRTSALVVTDQGAHILIDTSPDFRTQALRTPIPRVDAVLYTHAHADHILGLDDLRAYNFTQQSSIPCYLTEGTLDSIKRTFWYVFEPQPGYKGGLPPQLTFHLVTPNVPFEVAGTEVMPFALTHGGTEVIGFRFGSMAYATDCNQIPERSRPVLQGLDLLVLDALRAQPHPTHFSIPESIAVARALEVHRTVFVHMGHTVDYQRDSAQLPAGFEFAYDGMHLSW